MTETDPPEITAAARGPSGAEMLLATPPWLAITRLAAPTTLVMLVAATSNVLYTYFVSRLGSDAIAAVSLVFPVSLLATTAMAGGVGAGASSAVARALGAGRRREAMHIGEHALALSVALGLLFALLILVGGPALFRVMGGKGRVLESAVGFARIMFGGATITFVAAMFDSIMRGEGNVRVPAIWSSTSLGLQILLTPLLMFVAGWGLTGAALAVLASQLIAAVPRARHMFGELGLLARSTWPPRLSIVPFREILRVGVPASLSTIISNLGVMVLTAVVAHLGEAHLAAYGLGSRLDFLLLSIAYGVGAAVLTLVGLATGAGRPELARSYVLRAGILIFAILALPSVLLWWRPGLWLDLFSDDPAIRGVGAQYLRIIGPSYPLMGISMLLAFAFQGLGRAGAPLALMSIRMIAVLAAALVCTQWLGMADRAVFAAVAVGNAVSAAALCVLFARVQARSRRPSAA